MERILFISSSDISIDPRILREIQSVSDLGFSYLALGITERDRRGKVLNEYIKSYNLFFRKLEKIPNFIKLIFLIKLLYLPLLFIEIFFRFIKSVLKFKPRIIHCSDHFLLPIAVIFKVLTRSKLIYDIHELESETFGLNKLFKYYIIFIEKICWPFVNGTIHVSPSIQKWYEKKYSIKKTEIILNSPNSKKLKKDNYYFHRKYDIRHDKKIFLYLGNLSTGRYINTLLDFFASNQNSAVIIFMGHGPLEKLILKYCDSYSNIFLHETVSHDIVTSISCSADFGLCLIENVSLSDYFCLPNKLFEYVFSDLPVISTDLPDICEVVRNYNLGIILETSSETKMLNQLQEIVDTEFIKPIEFNNIYPISGEYQSIKLQNFLMGFL